VYVYIQVHRERCAGEVTASLVSWIRQKNEKPLGKVQKEKNIIMKLHYDGVCQLEFRSLEKQVAVIVLSKNVLIVKSKFFYGLCYIVHRHNHHRHFYCLHFSPNTSSVENHVTQNSQVNHHFILCWLNGKCVYIVLQGVSVSLLDHHIISLCSLSFPQSNNKLVYENKSWPPSFYYTVLYTHPHSYIVHIHSHYKSYSVCSCWTLFRSV